MKRCCLFVLMPMLWLILAGVPLSLAAQDLLPAVKGLVKSKADVALSHVTVEVRNKKGDFYAHTFTDDEGVFTFSNLKPGDAYSFTFTHLGYSKKVLEGYSYKPGEMITLSVQLTETVKDMNPVVVTALGVKREAKTLSYSQQSVDVNSLNETKDPNFINSLSLSYRCKYGGEIHFYEVIRYCRLSFTYGLPRCGGENGILRERRSLFYHQRTR